MKKFLLGAALCLLTIGFGILLTILVGIMIEAEKDHECIPAELNSEFENYS